MSRAVRRRAPPPPTPALSLSLTHLSLEHRDHRDHRDHGDHGYHTLAETPARRRTVVHTHADLTDQLWVKVMTYLEISEVVRCGAVCARWRRLSLAACREPAVWSTVVAGGGGSLQRGAVMAARRAGQLTVLVRTWRMRAAMVCAWGTQRLAESFTQLRRISLPAANGLDSRTLAPLLNLEHLEHLEVPGCTELEWPDWRLRRHTTPLKLLDLSDCSKVSDVGLESVLHSCPALQYLYLRRCVLITDASVRRIPSFCSLKELSVSDCTSVTDFGVYELAKLGASLRYISVAKCTQVSDTGLQALARRCYKLRYVNVRGCVAIGDRGVDALARGCGRLRALDLGATDVADPGLQILARCCPNLKKLGLRGCELVTDAGLQAVSYCCRGLTHLNIQDTGVTTPGYRAVKQYCKRCVIEHSNPGFC